MGHIFSIVSCKLQVCVRLDGLMKQSGEIYIFNRITESITERFGLEKTLRII